MQKHKTGSFAWRCDKIEKIDSAGLFCSPYRMKDTGREIEAPMPSEGTLIVVSEREIHAGGITGRSKEHRYVGRVIREFRDVAKNELSVDIEVLYCPTPKPFDVRRNGIVTITGFDLLSRRVVYAPVTQELEELMTCDYSAFNLREYDVDPFDKTFYESTFSFIGAVKGGF